MCPRLTFGEQICWAVVFSLLGPIKIESKNIINLELKFSYNKAVVQFNDCFITSE